MERKFEKWLEDNGWTVTCLSPLEISHFEGSDASGMCAKYTLDALEDEYKDEINGEDESKRIKKLLNFLVDDVELLKSSNDVNYAETKLFKLK